MGNRVCNRVETWREEKNDGGGGAVQKGRDRYTLEAQKMTEDRNFQWGFLGGKLYPMVCDTSMCLSK